METMIKIQNINKTYDLGVRSEDFIKYSFGGLFKSKKGGKLKQIEALKNVSFEVREGEALALVGRNGSGKSTLLKILSRITSPTSGSVIYKGRLASLLEVGSGFHPELTGRDNVFFNGALLGMSRSQVKLKFDEIVAFSGVEEFLDLPVKKYSSGMYVRLAYSVGAFLENEILILDEVLSVGDKEFQDKCLANINRMKSEGKTLIVVSHNHSFLEKFCDRMVWLEKGEMKYDGALVDYDGLI